MPRLAGNRPVQRGESPCGKGLIQFWNLGTRREVGTLRGHGCMVVDVAFSPDGVLLTLPQQLTHVASGELQVLIQRITTDKRLSNTGSASARF